MNSRAKVPIVVGKIKFTVEYRRSSWNEGAVIRVFFLDGGMERQVLKFDPLIHNPHYHIDPDGRDIVLAIRADNSLGWSLSQIAERMTDLFREAGYGGAASDIDQDAIREALPEIESTLKKIMMGS